MSYSLDANIWLGCYWDDKLFNDESLLEEGITLSDFIDEDGEIDMYEILEAINKAFDCDLGYTIMYDSQEKYERIIGVKLTGDGDWEAKEFCLTRTKMREEELTPLLNHLFKDFQVNTYLVPSYF